MMAYQAAPYAAPGAADSYYKDYYAAYGCYDGSYNMAAYYQQQHAQYGAAASGNAQYPQSASEVSTLPQVPPPPPPEPAADAPGKKVSSDKPPLPGSSSDSAPPLPSQSDATPPPPPPPPPPPSQESTAGQAPTTAVTASGEGGAASSSADAYAQWYAQNYGAYYGAYTGYEQQWYAYWQQQQQQQQHQGDAYSYASAAFAQPQQQQQPGPLQPELPGGASSKENGPAGASSSPHFFNAQPPPTGLYSAQQQQRMNQARLRSGPTGPNTVPIGPRANGGEMSGASVSGGLSLGKQQPAIVIRPQVPLAKRTANAATPSYISVDSSSPAAAATTNGTSEGRTAAVAAAVAAGAASAAAAASAAKAVSAQGASQFPPSFTAWVTRCFNTARLRNIPDNHLSAKLMAYLDQVKKEGKLWTTDWDTHPMMLPESSSGQQDAGSSTRESGTSNQVLSIDGTPGRKRNRWGAVPETHVNQERHHSQDHHQHLNGYRKRGHDADSDDEYHSGHGDGATLKQSVHHVGGLQTMSNRKRKKLLQLEQQQQANSGRRGGRGVVSVEEQRRQARAGRFGNGRASGTVAAGSTLDNDSSGMDMSDEEEVVAHRFDGQIVGTCQALEKSYFRLTSKPDPATVRPEPVLERALERLVSMIARGEASYFYSLDQFKGMRQDCTVQHLRNGLAVRVYEAHARSSLEYADTAEFNQCQARLGHLYAEGQPGCVAEFTAYRVIYETVHCAAAGQRGGGMAKALMHTIRNIPRELIGTEEIRHALQVREAVMTYNYAAFFRLYASAPHLGRAIMDVVAESVRWSGLNAFVKACDLPLPVAELAQLLGFSPRPGASTGKAADSDAKPLPGCMRAHLVGDAAAAATADEGTADCAAWLRDHGAVVVEKGTELVLDTKASRGKLFVPEVTAKVAHGDENLSVNDFLSQAQRNLAA